MIKSFYDPGTEDIFNRIGSKEARRTCPEYLWKISRRKLDQLNAAVSLGALRIPPGNKLGNLKGDRQGQHSIRINEQFRVCFIWTDEGPDGLKLRIITE